MEFRPADLTSVALFTLLCVVVAIVIAGALRRAHASRATRWGLVAYLVGFTAIVAVAPLDARPLPLVPILFASVLITASWVGLSRLGGRLAAAHSLGLLIGVQAFRLPLELILHHWVERGTIPATMTWTGRNWDVISGAVTLVAAPWCERHRRLAWGVSLVSAALLLNVVRVVVMSAPLPFAWDVTPPLRLIGHLPYAFIGPLCVGTAIACHILAFRRLLSSAAPR